MSKMPTRASRLAAVVSGIPWSCAAGMKWVATRPLVLAPQIAKPPASNQNVPVRGTPRAVRAGPAGPPRCCAPRVGGGRVRAGPVGGEADVGRVVAQQHSTSGTTARAPPVTVSAARASRAPASEPAAAGRSAARSRRPRSVRR